MNDGMEKFQRELYEEHLEEASFLYEQRLSLVHSTELSWADLHEFDQRHDAHINGLVVGNDLALGLCLDRACSTEFGEFHAAITVCCRQRRLDLLIQIFKGTDWEDEEYQEAAHNALALACPDDWLPPLTDFSEREMRPMFPILIRLIGWRRFSEGNDFLERRRDREEFHAALAWSYGRLATAHATAWLKSRQAEAEEDVWRQTSLALLRLGDPSIPEVLARRAQFEAWARLPLALCGSREDAQSLLKITTELPDAESPLALGLLGDIAALDTLIDILNIAESAENAALALNLITGADLYEEVFVPEEIDEDELFDDEKEKIDTGKHWVREDGSPYGATVTRLCRDQNMWRDWWLEHGQRFQAETRYRSGKPYAPGVLIDNLTADALPNRVRELIHHELLIRYRADVPFELEMHVADQRNAIDQYKSWLHEKTEEWKDGAWYFAGVCL